MIDAVANAGVRVSTHCLHHELLKKSPFLVSPGKYYVVFLVVKYFGLQVCLIYYCRLVHAFELMDEHANMDNSDERRYMDMAVGRRNPHKVLSDSSDRH